MRLFNGNKPKSRKKRENKQGQAMVEFALALPILMLIIVGLLEAGRLVFMYGAIITSSREAVRYGSVIGLVDGNPDAFRYQDCAGIIQIAQDRAFLIDPSNLTVTIEYDTGEGTTVFDTCIDADGDGIDDGIDVTPLADGTPKRITVTVSTNYSPLVPLIPQFTIRDIESTSSRTYLGMIEYEP